MKMSMLHVIMTVMYLISSSYCSEDAVLFQDLKDALDNHERALKSVLTLHAVVKVRREGRFDSGTLKCWNKESIWFDRGSLCKRVTDGGFYGDRTEDLLIEETDEGRRKFASHLPVNWMEISTQEAQSVYDGSKNATIRHSENESMVQNLNYLFRYQSVFGRSLKEMLLRSYEEGKVEVVHQNLEGDDCLNLHWEFPNHAGGSVWLVPSKGYCIKKLQVIADDKIAREYVTTLKEYKPGFWWFDSAIVKEKLRNGVFERSEWIEIESVEFNQPIDPDKFTLKSLPQGTVVRDRQADLKYVVGTDRDVLDALDSVLEEIHVEMDSNGVNDQDDKAESKVYEVNLTGEINRGISGEEDVNRLSRHRMMIIGITLIALIVAVLFGLRKRKIQNEN